MPNPKITDIASLKFHPVARIAPRSTQKIKSFCKKKKQKNGEVGSAPPWTSSLWIRRKETMRPFKSQSTAVNKMIVESQAPEGHNLCAANSGFFGSLPVSDLCSKCHRDLRMKACPLNWCSEEAYLDPTPPHGLMAPISSSPISRSMNSIGPLKTEKPELISWNPSFRS